MSSIGGFGIQKAKKPISLKKTASFSVYIVFKIHISMFHLVLFLFFAVKKYIK